MSAATQKEMERLREENERLEGIILHLDKRWTKTEAELSAALDREQALAAHVERLQSKIEEYHDGNVAGEEALNDLGCMVRYLPNTTVNQSNNPAQVKTGDISTHVCSVCGACWRNNDDKSWSLQSSCCGTCCDNELMGSQILPITNDDSE